MQHVHVVLGDEVTNVCGAVGSCDGVQILLLSWCQRCVLRDRQRAGFIHSFIHCQAFDLVLLDPSGSTFRNGAAVMVLGIRTVVSCWSCGSHLAAGGLLIFTPLLKFTLASFNAVAREKTDILTDLWLVGYRKLKVSVCFKQNTAKVFISVLDT